MEVVAIRVDEFYIVLIQEASVIVFVPYAFVFFFPFDPSMSLHPSNLLS